MERQFNHHRQLTVPFAAAAHVLYDEPAVLFGLAREAAMKLANQHEFAPHVMTPVPTPDVEHDVEIEIGETHRVDDRSVMVPITWVAVDGSRWFPTVEARIEVTQLDERHPYSDLSFFGSYTPKGGIVGAVIDAAATHVVVEDTLEHFFDTMCIKLLETIAAEATAS